MTHTHTPTVIEEARKMARAMLDHNDPRWWAIGTGRGDRDPLVAAFIAAIELGERRAAAVVPTFDAEGSASLIYCGNGTET